jgi:hypothetical protein
MNIIQMIMKVGFVTQTMLIKPRLPQCLRAISFDRRWDTPGKSRFHHLPARGKIRIATRQIPHTVQMVGQYHRSQKFVRALMSNFPESLAKQHHPLFLGKNGLPAIADQRKEISAAWNVQASIIAHKITFTTYISHIQFTHKIVGRNKPIGVSGVLGICRKRYRLFRPTDISPIP